MALNAYQLISRVIPGRPFGDGRDGALTISADTTQPQTARTCNGTSGTTALTISSNGFSNGDIVLIHQSQGTGVGSWEVNMVTAGGGTTSLTLAQALQSGYATSGNNVAQIIKIPLYSSITIQSGKTWSAPAWGGATGGFLVFACNGVATMPGAFSVAAKGYVGGQGFVGANQDGYVAEGYPGPTTARNQTRNGSGGGGGRTDTEGAGGGHAANGADKATAQGGDTSGNSELSNLTFGGGGGGGGTGADGFADGQLGGNGAGAVVMFVANWTLTGSGSANGGAGGNHSYSQGHDGGNGAGGSILAEVGTADIGTNLLTAVAGTNTNGGAGSVGRIAIHYSANITGTSNPAFTQVFDGRLIEQSGGIAFFL